MATHLWSIIVKQVHTLHEGLFADLAQATMEERMRTRDVHVTTRQTDVYMEQGQSQPTEITWDSLTQWHYIMEFNEVMNMFMEATVMLVLCVLLTVCVSPAAAGQLLEGRGSVWACG